MFFLKRSYWKGQRSLLLLFLLLHVVVSSIYITWQNITFDEKDYYGYSIKWLHGHVERDNKIYDSKTPLVAIAAVPRLVKQVFSPGYKATDNGIADILDGRYMMVIFTLIIAVYLFKWIRISFGEKAWIIPLLFFLFDPLVMGFSMIITSDMASGACLLAATYHLFIFYRKRTLQQLLSFSAWLGVGFVCKASLLYMLPYLVILFVILLTAAKKKFDLKKTLGYSAITIAVVLAIMNLAYFGKGTFRPLSRSKFQSTSFQSLASTSLIKDIPVPLPYSYVQGLDMLQFHAEIGAGHLESTHHGVFVGEHSKDKGGFWYYYLYVGLFKIPIATLLLIIVGSIAAVLSSRSHFISKHLWYFLPFVFFFCILSFINPFQTGFRHFLLIYPFCFLFIAAAIAFMKKKMALAKPIAGSMLAYALISTCFFFPWLISYTNEFVIDKKMVFQKMKDSSIDYGQNAQQLEKFKKQHPGYKGATTKPQPGKYIVSAFQLINYSHRGNASWLSNFQPKAHYQYSMFLFEITDTDVTLPK